MFIVNAAYPAIAHTLHASIAQLSSAGNAYMFGLIVVIPLGTWLGHTLGARRLLVASLTLFALGSAGAGSASSMNGLLGYRLLQGLGGRLLIPVGQAMAYRAYPSVARGRLTSIVMMVALFVPALSPVLGGIMVESASWRWIFFGMGMIAVLAGALAFVWLPVDVAARRSGQLDIPASSPSSRWGWVPASARARRKAQRSSTCLRRK